MNAIQTGPPVFTSFLVKIASRCNLACDYCYMYTHADQSWRAQPPVLSERNRDLFARRVAEYAGEHGLDEVLVVFHGGEPLLAGVSVIREAARSVEAALPPSTRASFSLQTNGLLLTEDVLRELNEDGIAVSLSIDGPAHASDLHRLDLKGRSSFARTSAALERLREFPDIFAGVIAVVDPRIPPLDLFEFFGPLGLPALDFLLPDANHDVQPPGRAGAPDLYVDWLLEAFDLWFDRYADTPVRTFDAVLAAVAGHSSGTDAFGFGDVSVLSIETDGTYHDLDVLKITEEGRTALQLSLENDRIGSAALAPQIQFHRRLLTPEGLSDVCRSCPVVAVCGGGAVPHRFSSGTFENPSVYCRELRALIEHATRRLHEAVALEGAGLATTH